MIIQARRKSAANEITVLATDQIVTINFHFTLMKLVHLPTPEEPDLVVIPTDESDLYLLSKIIKVGDHVGSKTTRKVAVTQTQNVRKSMYLNVEVQQIVYQ